MLRATKIIAKALLSRIILRNLILLTAMSFLLLTLFDTGAFAILRSWSCSPSSCEDQTWNGEAYISADGSCDWDDNEWWVGVEAWVDYTCDPEDLTVNVAEANGTDYGLDGDAYAEFQGQTAFYIYEWSYCDSDNGEFSDEPGCP